MRLKRIKLGKPKNTRDLGGIPTKDGKHIKYNKLIRSGHLNELTDKDKKILVGKHNLKTVIDLRIEAEINEKPDQGIENVNYLYFPLLDKEYLGITRDEYSIMSWFNLFKDTNRRPEDIFFDMYDMLVFGERSTEYVKKIFDVLLEHGDGAVLWHCSAGKDRVGIVTMMILYALGVDRELITEDFLATNRFCFAEIAKTRIFSPFVIHERHLRKCLAVLMGVKREYADKIFDKIESEYENSEDFFLRHYNITPEEISLLRKKYLE